MCDRLLVSRCSHSRLKIVAATEVEHVQLYSQVASDLWSCDLIAVSISGFSALIAACDHVGDQSLSQCIQVW